MRRKRQREREREKKREIRKRLYIKKKETIEREWELLITGFVQLRSLLDFLVPSHVFGFWIAKLGKFHGGKGGDPSRAILRQNFVEKIIWMTSCFQIKVAG